VALALAALMVGLVSCSPSDQIAAFAVGGSYRLTLHLTSPAHLIPERAANFSPMVDSAILMLRVDSASGDSVFATFSGELRHFPVVFRSIDDSSVVIAEKHGHLTARVSASATDAGLELSGTRKQRVVSGSWRSLTQSSADSGDFTMRPGA
jgi:hypothetical protein